MNDIFMLSPQCHKPFLRAALLAQGMERLSDPGQAEAIIASVPAPLMVTSHLYSAHGKNPSTNGKTCVWAANFIQNQADEPDPWRHLFGVSFCSSQ